MKIALVASSFLPDRGRLERRVEQLARGAARRGAEVEVLTQGPVRATLGQGERVTVQCFPTGVGPFRLPVAPMLWERLRATADTFDIVDVHTRRAPLALAAASAPARRLVFTPGAPIDTFMGLPYRWAMRGLLGSATGIVCQSETDRDLLCQAVPQASRRVRVVPDGVDADSLDTAVPFSTGGTVVLAVDRLERTTGVARAIAAVPSLAPNFHLVVVGDGPARDRLRAYASDLRISSRLEFTGAVTDPVLHRWLRTASVVVVLSGDRGSGSQVTEARAAGASVVASDLPIHREAADRPGGGHVIFVPPHGSPLDVADAIDEAARLAVLSRSGALASSASSWEAVVDATWSLYQELVESPAPAAIHGGSDDLLVELNSAAAPALKALVEPARNGGPEWP